MKFNKVYSEIEQRLKESIISLWATGDSHLQKYLLEILSNEKLMSLPAFQNTFSWQTASEKFGDLDHLFSKNFVNKLDTIKGEYEFPKGRLPYLHQVKSWEALLKTNKSIAVTTGTGSGKTECFMIPVLQDLYQNCKDQIGVNAIFLYPLNALIGSQKKRIDSWVRALGGLSYCVYNGNTQETVASKIAKAKYPEIVDRKTIRDTPPQILFTNPSMLEYILVRNRDVSLLEKSQGKLRWILLDEAHTLTGSNATEMALLIRRVIDAFGVEAKDIRFAITSATVGKGANSESSLKRFMANLCGIDETSIVIIEGNRIFNDLPEDLSIKDKKKVELKRKLIYNKDAVLLDDLVEGLVSKDACITEKLDKVDELSETLVEGKSILPLRGHYYTRGIGGVYVCSNSKCEKHSTYKTHSPLGIMTTFAEKKCSSCHFPMYELVACRSCGNELFKGDLEIKNDGTQVVNFCTDIVQDAFKVDNIDVVDEEASTLESSVSSELFFTRKLKGRFYTNNTIEFDLNQKGEVSYLNDEFIKGDIDNHCVCPHCNGNLDNPLHFRMSSSFINRVLSDVLLENTPESSEVTQSTLWNGHKYISFSDSRQGTAKISALVNIDNENRWIQSQVYHKLLEKWKKLAYDAIQEEDRQEIVKALNRAYERLKTATINVIIKGIEDQIASYQKALSSNSPKVELTWKEALEFLGSRSDIKTLFKNNNPLETNFNHLERYTKGLLFDNFARRLPRERSLENLGLISINVKEFDSQSSPTIALQYDINNKEWQSLLKIALDYVIRYGFYFNVPQEIYPYSSSFLRSFFIYNSDTEIINVKKWPVYRKDDLRPNRLSLLLLAGLGFSCREEIDDRIEDDINQILNELWKVIRSKFLTLDGQGAKLHFEDKVVFSLTETVWLCPVKKRLIDAQFRNYSPWISGEFSADNIQYYKIKEEKGFEFPRLDNPFNLNEENIEDINYTKDWIKENSLKWREFGIWNDLHSKILLNRPIYLAGEHSAQLSERRLQELEQNFDNAHINILNCSTTMEMGVDIGGISTVVMNNVPPGPANYLQRSGRAGRRNENKSLAFTICAPNPVGLNALSNPLWALEHEIAPPYVAFKSQQIIERHLNAFFFGKFVQLEVYGINVRDKVENFFFTDQDSVASRFSIWLTDPAILSLKTKVISLVKNTIIEDYSFKVLVQMVIDNFRGIYSRTQDEYKGFNEKLQQMSEDFGQDSPAYKSVSHQYKQFLSQNAISYLAQNGFLPTAGLPTGIIEFEISAIEDLKVPQVNKRNPSYYITRALTEYAPGKQIVIDGMNYRSAGIVMHNVRGDQSKKSVVQSCRSCGAQRIVEIAEGQNIDSICNHCEGNSFSGIQFSDVEARGAFTEVIEPAGFAVDIFSTPNRKIEETSRSQYVDPILINAKPWTTDLKSLYEVRESDNNAEILFYNIGVGNGFTLCLHCGRADTNADNLVEHRRLRGGKNKDETTACTGNNMPNAIKSNIILGGRFKTDYAELRLRQNGNFSNDESLLYTLGAVFTKELAKYLAIETTELGFGVKQYDGFKTIFIFDTMKGGAGYATQLYAYVDDVFKAAKLRLECTCESGCTKCIIDRDTQWHLNLLDRNLALDWLKSNLEREIPVAIQGSLSNPRFVLGGVRHDLGRLIHSGALQEINMFVSSSIKDWNLEELHFLYELKNKTRINLIFKQEPIIMDDNDLVTLIQIKANANLYILDHTSEFSLEQICFVKLSDDSTVGYYTDSSVDLNLNINWGSIENGFAYAANAQNLKINEFLIPTSREGSTIQEVLINIDTVISSKHLVDSILNKIAENNSINFQSEMKKILKDQIVNVTYSDNYLKTPFGVILMLQFVLRLKELFEFNINDFNFYGKEFVQDKRPLKLFHDFEDSESRNGYLRALAYELDVFGEIIAMDGDNAHYRFFKLSNSKFTIFIRPDAGVEHGWQIEYKKGGFNGNVQEFDSLDQDLRIMKRNTQPILYTISVNKQ